MVNFWLCDIIQPIFDMIVGFWPTFIIIIGCKSFKDIKVNYFIKFIKI